MVSLLWMLLIGLFAGMAAAWFVGSSKPGWLPTIVIGVLGSFVGGFLFRLVGFTVTNVIGELIAATAGAIVCIYAIRAWGKKL